MPSCTVPVPEEPEPDPLIAHRDRAARDAEAALSAAAASGEDAAMLTTIAAQRGTHARTLDAEIRRLAPPTESPDITTEADQPPDPDPGAAPNLSAVVEGLAESAESSAADAARLTGYRAGLLASVSANCRSQLAMVSEYTLPTLTTPRQPSDFTDDPAVTSLAEALEREHAAVFSYGVITAFSLPERRSFVTAVADEHRTRRDLLTGLLSTLQVPAPAAAPAYSLPVEVDSAATAAELAVTVERECAVAWRAVTERADHRRLRELGTAALAECAVRTAQWRDALDATPRTDVFPGDPD